MFSIQIKTLTYAEKAVSFISNVCNVKLAKLGQGVLTQSRSSLR